MCVKNDLGTHWVTLSSDNVVSKIHRFAKLCQQWQLSLASSSVQHFQTAAAQFHVNSVSNLMTGQNYTWLLFQLKCFLQASVYTPPEIMCEGRSSTHTKSVISVTKKWFVAMSVSVRLAQLWFSTSSAKSQTFRGLSCVSIPVVTNQVWVQLNSSSTGRILKLPSVPQRTGAE